MEHFCNNFMTCLKQMRRSPKSIPGSPKQSKLGSILLSNVDQHLIKVIKYDRDYKIQDCRFLILISLPIGEHFRHWSASYSCAWQTVTVVSALLAAGCWTGRNRPPHGFGVTYLPVGLPPPQMSPGPLWGTKLKMFDDFP